MQVTAGEATPAEGPSGGGLTGTSRRIADPPATDSMVPEYVASM